MLDSRASARSRALPVGTALIVLAAVPVLAWQAARGPLFRSEEFEPHGFCFLWDPALTRLFVGSDLLIGLAYTGIGGVLAYFVFRERQDLPFQWAFLAFALFIVACGGTHYVDVLTLYVPAYWLSAGLKFVTAAASVMTAVALPPLLPRVTEMMRAARQAEIRRVELEEAHAQLERAHAELAVIHQGTRGELAAIVESSQDAIIGRDLTGRITSWNPGAERLLGYTAAEALGRPLPQLLPPQREDELEAALARVARGEAEPAFETARVRKDGQRVPVSVSVSPIRGAGGAVAGYAVIARDVNERMRVEQERERLLAQEQAARAEAEAAVRARDEFLSVAAHELKTPLTSLLASAQLAQRRLARSGVLAPDDARRALDTIERQAIRSARLVTRLFDLAQLEAGTLALHRQPVDVGHLVEEAAAAVRVTGDRHGVVVRRPDGPLVVVADPLRMEQVLVHLLDNAVRYSPEGAAVTVEVAPLEDAAGGSGQKAGVPPSVRIVVADRGVGVPPAFRAHLFDRFSQAHSGEYRSGLGVGLHLCRAIVERHGGGIEAEFPPEGGTRIVVTLPAAPAEPADARAGPPAVGSSGA